jgi:hypothetical protein
MDEWRTWATGQVEVAPPYGIRQFQAKRATNVLAYSGSFIGRSKPALRHLLGLA